MRRTFSLIDVFGGGGGYSRGFVEAGFKVLAAIENNPPVAKTYKANFPEALVIAEDVKEVGYPLLKSLLGISRSDVEVVIASPPCEPFTEANPKRMKDPLDRLYVDPAGQLFLHAIRIIGDLQPKVFVIENVRGILEPPIAKSIKRELERAGYPRVYFNVLKAEEHGCPSARTRVFVSNIKIDPPKKPGPSVWEVLKDLPPPGSSYPPNHEYPQELSKRMKARVSKLRWGEALLFFEGATRRHPNYVRLDPEKRAPTVMGSSRFIHPYEDRLLTVREQARLMGFPDYHIFLGSKDLQYDMVGEAVPPPLARAIAECVIRVLSES